MRSYIIGAVGTKFVKIGQTKAASLAGRLKQLQLGCPYKLSLLYDGSGMESEGELHRRFAKYHVRGEWFLLSREIHDFLKSKGPELLAKYETERTVKRHKCPSELHHKDVKELFDSLSLPLDGDGAKPTQWRPKPERPEPSQCLQCGGIIPRRTMANGKLESVTGWLTRKYCSPLCWGTYVHLHPEARRGGRPRKGEKAPRHRLGRPRLTERVERLERVVVGLMSERERNANDGGGTSP